MDAIASRIGIVGGGPSALFLFKALMDAVSPEAEITIFERKEHLGAGMPYSTEGANREHVTNVSDNEIPALVCSVEEWVQTVPKDQLDHFGISASHFNTYKVLPRLFFGAYLEAQFGLLLDKARADGITVHVVSGVEVTDIQDGNDGVAVTLNGKDRHLFDKVVVCTGHNWPRKHEGKIPGYFDAPYPPSRLKLQLNHAVAIRGSSLTAIDAIRTLARHNGTFETDKDGRMRFDLAETSPDFKIVMHSRNGLLPAVRFHLEDSHLNNDSLLTEEELQDHISKNDGFLSLDFIFDRDFKAPIKEHDPAFYARIKDMKMEEFVESMMALRERLDAFTLFRAEYVEAEKSIKRRESIYWKEMLAVLSFAMNYPAKYFSAEDMLRLQQTLMPLISVVIAFVPQQSCVELLALHDAGVLDMVAVGHDSQVIPKKTGGIDYQYRDDDGTARKVHYQTFVDCVGQPHLAYEDVPFPGLIAGQTISKARLRFRSAAAGAALKAHNPLVEADMSGHYYLRVPGIGINDHFQVLDPYGAYNEKIYMMAVPYMGGFNPDYSGLDFCEAASKKIVEGLLATQ